MDISSLHQEMGQIQTDVRIQEKSVNDEEKIVEKLELEALTKQVLFTHNFRFKEKYKKTFSYFKRIFTMSFSLHFIIIAFPTGRSSNSSDQTNPNAERG